MKRKSWERLLITGCIAALLTASPGVAVMAADNSEVSGVEAEVLKEPIVSSAESDAIVPDLQEEMLPENAGSEADPQGQVSTEDAVSEADQQEQTPSDSGSDSGQDAGEAGEYGDEAVNEPAGEVTEELTDTEEKAEGVGASLEDSSVETTESSAVGIDILFISGKCSVLKVVEQENGYVPLQDASDDIAERYTESSDSSEGKVLSGYDLQDGEASYKVSQTPAGEMKLVMNYEDASFRAEAEKGDYAIFDKKGYVEVSGESTDYELAMSFTKDHPTPWFSAEVYGSGADCASLTRTEEGYLLKADVLDNILVTVSDREVSETLSFSSTEKEALICASDEGKPDIRFDTDQDGTYETSIADIKGIEKATVAGISLSYGYSGKAYTPTLKITLDGESLVRDVDYTVAYENNVEPGTARVIITGRGKYKGTLIKTFKIIDCASTLVSGKIYQIIPKNNSGTAVCPYCGRTAKNTKVYITNRSESKAMRYKAVKNSDGTWKFFNVKSGRVLAVQQNKSTVGAGIVLYDSTTRKAQNWKLVRKSDNSFAIKNAVTGYSIAMSDPTAVKGTTLSMAKSASTGIQRFYFVDVETQSVVAETTETSETALPSSDEDFVGITTGETVVTDASEIEISEPTLKLYGYLGKTGGGELQSMVISGNFIYTYSGQSGRFYKVNMTTHARTLYTLANGYVIDKGNGMTCDGTNLYLVGENNKIYTVPLSAFGSSATIKYSKATDIGVKLNGICYDRNEKKLYAYRKYDSAGKLVFYNINLSAALNSRAKPIFEAKWDEALAYDQDMEVIGDYFYIVSDYPGSMVKISKNGKVIQNYRLSQYADRGAYTGEFEGICQNGDRILLASAHTGYLSSDSILPAIGYQNPEDGVILRQSRTIVFTEMDPVKDITPVDPYMRGAVAMQKAVVYVDFEKNTWQPDGTAENPYPSPVTAFCARKNPRYEYIFDIVNPEYDVNNKPFMIITNQNDVTIHLEKACSNSNGIMSLYIYNSKITLSSETNFRINYMIDSEVDYVSSPSYCQSVMHYDTGNGTSRFNATAQMTNDFGLTGSTPNGNYMYQRQVGSASGSPIVLANDHSVYLPAGKMFNIIVYLTNNGGFFSGNGIGNRGTTLLPMVNSNGETAQVELGYNESTDSVYVARIRRALATADEKSISYAVLNVNMA